MQNEQILNNNIIYCGTDNTNDIGTSDFNNGNQHSTILSTCKIFHEESNSILETNINIYRYKFSIVFAEKMYEFSKIHQYDNRFDFKEAWIQWTKDNDEYIQMEIERLSRLDYKGNILEKMFKSVRYYYRKKNNEIKTPQDRKRYINISKEILEKIDKHLRENIQLKPKDAFIHFCNEYKEELKEIIIEIYNNGITDSNEIHEKIKKTYKNRYFISINNNKFK
jgi:hypothetical protein